MDLPQYPPSPILNESLCNAYFTLESSFAGCWPNNLKLNCSTIPLPIKI